MSSILETKLETELELELNIDPTVFWGFNHPGGLEKFRETYESIEKLSKIPLLHPEANRRKIAVSFVRDDPDHNFEKSTKTYSIIDYKNDVYLKGIHYSVDKVKEM